MCLKSRFFKISEYDSTKGSEQQYLLFFLSDITELQDIVLEITKEDPRQKQQVFDKIINKADEEEDGTIDCEELCCDPSFIHKRNSKTRSIPQILFKKKNFCKKEKMTKASTSCQNKKNKFFYSKE